MQPYICIRICLMDLDLFAVPTKGFYYSAFQFNVFSLDSELTTLCREWRWQHYCCWHQTWQSILQISFTIDPRTREEKKFAGKVQVNCATYLQKERKTRIVCSGWGIIYKFTLISTSVEDNGWGLWPLKWKSNKKWYQNLKDPPCSILADPAH